MATAITTRSPTLEGQLLEIVNAILEYEKSPDTNPQNIHYISGQWQVVGDEFSFQGSFNVKTTGSVNENGELVLRPFVYLVSPQS